tara:strand:+ start:1701 stop:4541 length:2841 start_codon:yes stop_codon:yes gene_type:complete
MHGFKSFPRKTEIPLENSMNVIIGPNGSGKSNITDAICFVLGRLSIKSIRAAKAANLLFSGNKNYKGSQEASVEIYFNNSDKTFSIDSSELILKRTVKKGGQSIYKINGQTKTRQEIIEILAQGGIDPNGFNIILQGKIQSLVKSTSEERRKIIEEVSGISIYEVRKQKSIRELEKTEEKLREVLAVLKERNSYLKNLGKERKEAMQYKKLEETINKCKATLIYKDIISKDKEILEIEKEIEKQQREIEKLKKKIIEEDIGVKNLQEKILIINKNIHSSTGNEQEIIHKELSDLKAGLAGLNVRKENFEGRIESGKEKIDFIKKKIKELNKQILNIQSSSPKIKAKKEKERILQENFDILEKQKRKFYIIKSNLTALESEKFQKEETLIETKKEIKSIKEEIDYGLQKIKYSGSTKEITTLKDETDKKIINLQGKISNLQNEILEKEKENAVLKIDIKRGQKLKDGVIGLQTCPICKQKVEEIHKDKISTRANEKINYADNLLEKNKKIQIKNKKEVEGLEKDLNYLRMKINKLEIDKMILKNFEEKKEQIKKLFTKNNLLKGKIEEINGKLSKLREEFEKLKSVEEKYDEARIKIQEISFTDSDVDTEAAIKIREINRISNESKSIERDSEDSSIELEKIKISINQKNKSLEEKEIEEQELYERFKRFFEDRNELQDQQKVLETEIIGMQHTIKNFESEINHNKVQKAQFLAQIDSLKTEFSEFGNIEIIEGPIDQLKEKLSSSQFRISRIGDVNMRALEVFDKVREQCNLIEEKVEIIKKEMAKIKDIIVEIDKKKKKSFMKTLEAINIYFTRNFTQLSRKGNAFLELENKKEPFEGGLNILVKASRGRYFDITSLSGGEKTIVALALIFAIQEYRPYCFYIFDEIDAELDKHNSELLTALIKKYMTSGQYIIITHNDALITEATTLYGVSMQENISKIVSLKI